MIRARNVLGILALVILAVLAALAVALSHDSACTTPAAPAAGVPTMKAIVRGCYGSADVLSLAEVARPEPADDELLVQVRTAALNPLDWHYMTGTPYAMRLESGFGRPRSDRLGVDFAGTVAAVGAKVTRFRPGDQVYGSRMGAFAEYVVLREGAALAPRPANLDFAQAAGLPVAALTALQALRDKAQVAPGDKVLVNGASGGVGTFAVQIAKSLGAEVTGVCSTRNVELVRSLGADHVIDYTQADFTRGTERYDAIIDAVGYHALRDVRRALVPDGVHVIIGGPKDERWIGPLLRFGTAPLASRFVTQRHAVLLATMNPADLLALNELADAGSITTVIDRRYALADLPEAMRYLETRRARGKVVFDVAP
jgi:NADPH:quinone reductase-like Zn-dependent oxidoreductase